MFYTRFLSPTDQKYAESSTYWQFFYYRPPGKFLQRARSLKCDAENLIYSYIYYIYIVTVSIIIWIFFICLCSYIELSWVTTEICWYFHYSCCSKHLTSHACALLIDNVGNYLYIYLNNGSFKSEVDPHQFNLRERKKIFKSWQVCDWLAKWLIVLGFMDLRWPRVYRRSNVGLVISG